MKYLSTIAKLAPPELLVVGNIRDLIEKLTSLEQDIHQASDAAISNIELVQTQYKTLRNSLHEVLKSPSLETINAFAVLVSELSSDLNISSLKPNLNVFEQDSFIRAMQGIERAKMLFNDAQVLTEAIGELADIAKVITVGKEHETPIKDIALGFCVEAQASILIKIHKDGAIRDQLGMSNTSNNVIINHQAMAKLLAGAKASALIKSIQFSGALQISTDLSLDIYYQVSRHIQSYLALWTMFASTPKFWQFESVKNALQHTDEQGCRAISIKGKRKFSLWGSVSFGHSLVTQMDLDSREVGIDISAKASYSRKHTYEGDARLFITKSGADTLKIKVEFDHKTVNSSNFAMGLNAEFTGLDKVAHDYANLLLGKGDEIVASLAQYSASGLSITEAINEQLGQDKWYSPLATLILSEAQPDDAMKQMLSSTLQLFLDTHFFTNEPADETEQQLSTEALASSAIDYLHDKLGPQSDDAFVTKEEAEQIKTMLQDRLIKLIKAKQTELNEQAMGFVDQIKQKLTLEGQQALAPLYALGEEVRSKLNEVLSDANIVAAQAQEILLLTITRYTTFKKRLQAVIEKSQNIKLAISHESSKSQLNNKAISFTLLFKKQSDSAKRLYQLLLLGADERANLLMLSMLKRDELEITERSERVKRTLVHTSTQTLSILGFDTKQTLQTINDLDITVDGAGNIKIIGNAAVNAIAEGEFERREASANISYGFAQAALDEATNSQNINTAGSRALNTNFDLAYVNQDAQLHSEQELRDLFNSLCFPNRDLSSLQTPLPTIVTSQAIDSAIQTYLEQKSAYTSSKISIQMRASEDVLRQMLALNNIAVFNVCTDYLRAVFVDNTRKEYANAIFDAFMGAQPASNHNKGEQQSSEPMFDNYFDMYTHISVRGQLGKIQKRRLAAKLRDLNIPDDRFVGLDGSSRTSASSQKWSDALRQVSMIGQDASKTMQLPDSLNGIRDAVVHYIELPDAQKTDGLLILNKQLNRYNRDISNAFEPWIEVESVLANRLKDIMSKHGMGLANINYRLLALFMSLSTLIKSDGPLFTTSITLDSPKKPAKVILVN